MGIGNFGLTEIAVIVVLVLVFFGPKELPEIVRTLAHLFRDLRRSVNEVMREFDELQRMDEGGGGGDEGRRSGRPPRPGDRVLPPDARRGEGRGDGPREGDAGAGEAGESAEAGRRAGDGAEGIDEAGEADGAAGTDEDAAGESGPDER